MKHFDDEERAPMSVAFEAAQTRTKRRAYNARSF
jgi:hypothetical protein